MQLLINGLLLLVVLATPITITVLVHRTMRRHGLEPQYGQQETIDYDKW